MNRKAYPTLIIAFCLWHMFAVAAYLLPDKSVGVAGAIRDLSEPYVLSLSQWQKWDIFSPDPQRKVSLYRINRNAGDRWITVMNFDREHLGFFERAKELKILGRLESNQWNALVAPYLRSLCSRIPESAGTEIQLVAMSTILPRELSALMQLRNERLEITEKILGTYRCKLRL